MLKRWRIFPSCTSCILKITWHTSLSPHAHALQQPQVCLDDDQILHLCRFSIDYVKTWNHWFQLIILFNKPSMGASLPSSGWRCFHKPRRPSHSLIFFIQHFPFSIRCNDKTQFQGKLWTILVSSPILTKWRRCHWWWWHPKLRCQPLLLLLDTRLDTRTFYYYSTRTRLEVKNHYSQKSLIPSLFSFWEQYFVSTALSCFHLCYKTSPIP